MTPPRPRFWQSRRRHGVHGVPCDWGIKETHYKIIRTHHNKQHIETCDECAEQRFETADGDIKRCALYACLAIPLHVTKISEVRLKGMWLSGQRLIVMRPNGMRPDGMRPNRMRPDGMRLKGYGSRERGLSECGPTECHRQGVTATTTGKSLC